MDRRRTLLNDDTVVLDPISLHNWLEVLNCTSFAARERSKRCWQSY